MLVIRGIEKVSTPFAHSVLTIGNFDGVHCAHQNILAQAGLFAANTGGPVVVLTFEPHPLSIVAPAKTPERLSPLDEKLALLELAGATVVVVAKSEPGLLGMSAQAFFEEVVTARFNPTHIVEGPTFGFGKGRKGTPDTLRQLAAASGCMVHIVDAMTMRVDDADDIVVSSSMIRQLLYEGKVRRAGLCLGRRYALEGEVVEGVRRGRTLGFPTANLEVPGRLIPGDSVFAGKAGVEGNWFDCAISIGVKPTYGESARCIEAHLLDFEGDLYGKRMRLEFIRRIRHQQKFESPEHLVAQLQKDVEIVRKEAGQSGAHTDALMHRALESTD